MKICLLLYVSLVALGFGSARYFNDYNIINGHGQGHQSHDGYNDVTQVVMNDVDNGCQGSPQYEYPFMCQDNDKEFDSFNDDSQESRDFSKELENVEEYSILYQINNKNQEDERDNGFQENGYQRILDWIYTSGKENKKVNSNKGNKNWNQRMQTKNNGGRVYSQHSFPQYDFVNNGWHSSNSRNGNRGSYADRGYGNESPGRKKYNNDVLDSGKENDGENDDNKSDGRQSDGVYNDVNQIYRIHTVSIHNDNQNEGVHTDDVYNNDNQTDGQRIDSVYTNDNQTDGLHSDDVHDGNQTDGHRIDSVYNNDNQTDGLHSDDVHDGNQTDGLHTDALYNDNNQTKGLHTEGDDDNQTDELHINGVYNDANQIDGFQVDGEYNVENQTDGRQYDEDNQSTEQNKDEYQTTESMRLYMNRANKQ